MTAYTDQRDAAGRQPFWILEVTLDQCDNEFGTSPCTASGADGARCFHSWATCQDRTNFVKGTQTWRFLSSYVEPRDIPTIWGTWATLYPILGKIDHIEQEVAIFGGYTRQALRKFKLADIAGNDENPVVPELSPGKTTVNTTRAGSFWRRFVAIHPNYVNRDVKLYQGFVTPTFATSDLKTLFEGRLSGLTIERDGGVTLEAEDKLGDFEKKLPAKIGKSNTIQTSLNRTDTSIVVNDAGEYTDPSTQPGSYTVAEMVTISGRKELVKITARDTGTNTLTVTRGAFGTPAEPTRGDDLLGDGRGQRLVEVLHYSSDDGLTGLDAFDVAQDLLQRAGIASADIDSTSFDAAKAWVGPWTVKRTIEKPTQVKKLLHELLELHQSVLYIDDDRKIKVWTTRPADPSETVGSVTDTDILERGVQYDQGEDRRLTHASITYGEEGSENVAIYINDEAFTANFFGASEENRYERALKGGEWLTSWDQYQAVASCSKWAKYSETGRERVIFEAELRSESDLVPGTLVDLSTKRVQDEYGAARSLRCVVSARKRKSMGRYLITLEATGGGKEDGTQDNQRFAIMGPSGMTDYDSDTAANQAAYGYLADANDTLGAAGYRGTWLP